jgi:hypothetical protein
MAYNILIFEIILKYTTPPVWRIIEIKNNMTLHDLHKTIQLAMQWKNSHLYSFTRESNGHTIEYILPEYNSFEDKLVNNPKNYKLKDVFFQTGEKLEYLYDFGDNWEHEVIFKGRKEAYYMEDYPLIATGARACPPEDIGGIPGYRELLSAVAKKDKKKLAGFEEWLGYRYDPDKFSFSRFDKLSKMMKRIGE